MTATLTKNQMIYINMPQRNFVQINGFWCVPPFLFTLLIRNFIFIAMEAHKPTDATTNPSLILSAAQQEQYQHLIERAVKHGNKAGA